MLISIEGCDTMLIRSKECAQVQVTFSIQEGHFGTISVGGERLLAHFLFYFFLFCFFSFSIFPCKASTALKISAPGSRGVG